MFTRIQVALPITAIATSSATGRESFTLDRSGRYAQCREQAKRIWPKGGDDVDRARDFMISNCINDGSPGPFHPY